MNTYSEKGKKIRLKLPVNIFNKNKNDGTALVSRLQSQLVNEEFYSIKQCAIIGLLGVSLLLPSVTGIQYSLKKTNRNENGILSLSSFNN